MKGTIKVKVDTCMACQRCRLACFVEHSRSKTLLGAIQEDPPPWSNLHIRKVGVVAVPTSCHHCAAAVCMAVCPTGAIHRDGAGEPVVIDDSLCVGCESCVLICPYGVPQMTADHKSVEKCDQCVDRVREGRLPACVEACPTGSLEFVIHPEGEDVDRKVTLSVAEMYKRLLARDEEAQP